MNIWDMISRAGQPLDTRIRRDPLSIGVWLAVNVGWSGTITAIGATIAGSLVIGAIGIGLSLLAGAIFTPTPNAPTPSERQATLRQSIGARLRYYGRVKVGGTVGFFEHKGAFLYQLGTMNWGAIHHVVEHWLNDTAVSLNDDGYVIQGTFESEGRSRVRMLYKDGNPNQTAHSQLVSAFSSVIDANFRMRNMANYLVIFEEVKQEDISKVYPQLNPQVRHVIDASLCERSRQGDIAWSDNPSDVMFDYLVGRDGAGYPWGLGYQKSQINLDTFRAFATLSDQSIPLKLGGSIKRYRLWGGFAMNEEARQVITRFSRACDADLYMDTNGKIAIRGGEFAEPDLTLDMDEGHIISADFRHGNGALSAFNELTISYIEPELDFQEAECDPWLDTSNIAQRGGVLPERLALTEVPHFAQARRLGKIFTHKNNPEWSGTVITNFHGFNAIGEETVRIIFPLMRIDATFLIKSVRILDNFTGVELSVSSLSSSTYEWDAELEEGSPPNYPPDTTTPIELDPPADINVSVAERNLGGGGTGIFLIVTWTEPERTALQQDVEYRSSPGGTWIPMSVSDGAGMAESGLVTADIDYDVRVRTVAPGGNYGDWSGIITVAAIPDTGVAAPVENVAGIADAGEAIIGWDMSPDDWSIGARVYRNVLDDSATATLIATEYGSPGTHGDYVDEISAGTYYYWVASWTGSFVEGSREPTGAIVVS